MKPSDHRLRVRGIVANRVPAAAFPSSERVDAVVGDDVEAVLPLHDVSHARQSARTHFALKAPTRISILRMWNPLPMPGSVVN